MDSSQIRISRRLALAQSGAAGVAVGLLGLRVTNVAAQDATPAALPPVLTAFEAAWNANDDGSQFAGLLTPDVVWEVVPSGLLLHGPEACAAFYVEQMKATPDLKTTYRWWFVDERQAVAEWTNSGHYSGMFPGLPQGTGQLVSKRGVDLFALEGDKLSRITTYDDLLALYQQIGVIPSPVEAATPAP